MPKCGLAIFALLLSFKANAFEVTQVLPEGINSPSATYSWIENLDQRFNSSGSLVRLKDQYTFEFDVKSLEKLEPDVARLRTALNAVSNANLGEQLHLGYLSIDSEPSISYWVLSHAWGVSPKLTLGFGAPIVNYKNRISILQTGSNLDFYKQNLSGLSTELDSALQRLDTNLALEASELISEKGYKPVESINTNFIGDSQVVSVYKLHEKESFSVFHKGALNLPTGPKDNPDDLVDLGLFGQFYVQNSFIANQKWKKWSPVLALTHRFYIEDIVDVRVPRTEGDFLPDASSRQSVKRKIGDAFDLVLQAGYQLSQQWELLASASDSQQGSTQFTGVRGGEFRYDILGKDTSSRKQMWTLGANFSSVFDYVKSKKNIPLIGSFSYSDVFSASNSPRQTKSEMGLTLFY